MPADLATAFTDRVLMIRPAAFGWNPETAASNGFARAVGGHREELAAAARREFDAMVEVLVRAGLSPWVWDERPGPPRPDAVFPNNWISTHPGGRVHLYPMAAASRRAEVDLALVDELARRHRVTELVDWTHHADHGHHLEGTGSLVLDPRRRLAYACESSRTDPDLLRAWATREGYTPVLFAAHDAAGQPIYHTNVLLCVGHGFAACGLDLVAAPARADLRAQLEDGGELIELTPPQIDRFAGNMLQLIDHRGAPVCVLSQTALAALAPTQVQQLERHTTLLPVAIPTIEAVGGGSARCMLAELFLEPR
ncbi:MAG: amidinotransferase [Nannocystis sp.]|uniref:arginine deiminase-related protein n=1 Tax=Nannocystis sp. TaxID=1962667 RepID=UPI00242655FC|nr:arginine deiminase-related protein [Nannocystis sp.]MBK9753454.1 amidinotransferase [Nannocystis sp.]